MKKLLIYICTFLVLLASASADGVRFDQVVWSTATIGGISGAVVIVPSASISACSHPANAVPCTNKITTYTDATLSTPCPSATQIVLAGSSSCTGTTDAYGNWGIWAAAGTYDYTVSVNGQNLGPYPITLGGSGGGSSGNATQIQNKDVDAPSITNCLLQYNGTKFTCALATSANADSSIEKTANKDVNGGYLGISSIGDSNVAHDFTVGNLFTVSGPYLLTSFAAASPLGTAPSSKSVIGFDNDGFLGQSYNTGPFGKFVFALGKADVTNSSASIGSTNLYASAVSATYVASIFINTVGTCSTVGPGQVLATITFTDSFGTVNAATSAALFQTSGQARVATTIPLFSSGVNDIKYATTYTACTTGTGTYDIHIALTKVR